MAIYEITATEVVQRCATCGQENRIPLEDLEAGVSIPNGPPPDPSHIQLPPCPRCKSQEYLIRSTDGDPEHPAPGSFGHLHRLMVDHLHSEFIKANKVSKELRDQRGKADQKLARPIKQADRDKYFRRGFKIDAPNAGRAEAAAAPPAPAPASAPRPPPEPDVPDDE